MYLDGVASIAGGVLLILAGVGYNFVRSDPDAFEQDSQRFGPLNPMDKLFYKMLNTRPVRISIVAASVGMGLGLIIYGVNIL